MNIGRKVIIVHVIFIRQYGMENSQEKHANEGYIALKKSNQ